MNDTHRPPGKPELDQARSALNAGNLEAARHWAAKAARSDPNEEEAWLILAAGAEADESIRFCLRALEVRPSSIRARKALHAALRSQRCSEPNFNPVKKTQGNKALLNQEITQKVKVETSFTSTISKAGPPLRNFKPRRTGWIAVLFCMLGLLLVTCLAGGFWLIFPGSWIALAKNDPGPRPVGELEKATTTPTATTTSTATFTPTATATNTPTWTPTSSPSPSITNTPVPSDTSPPPFLPTITPFSVQEFQVAQALPYLEQYQAGISDRWIDVNLSQQMVYAFEGNTIVNSFIVSTGTSLHPTVTGQFNIYVKYQSGSMTGPGYSLPNVPYIMYFHKGYGLHGTYWHNNFGTPMSHGCINLRTEDAAWLYNWASIGTLVNIHY